MIEARNLQPKSCRCCGTTYQGKTNGIFNADIEPGKSIRIHGQVNDRVRHDKETRKTFYGSYLFDLTFGIGDGMAYDSYNLIYTATIVKITGKTVTVRQDHSERTRRLDLHTFIIRNWDYNEQKIADHNASEMQCI